MGVTLPSFTRAQNCSRAAGEDIIARATEEIGPGERSTGLIEGDGVIPTLSKRLDQRRVRHRCRPAHDRYSAAVHEDRSGRVSGDCDRVGE